MFSTWRLAFLFFLTTAATVSADDWPQFRGPRRDGVSAEKGLLQAWPKEGPKLLWTYREAGMGFSGPSIVGDRLYCLGGSEKDGEYVYCLDLTTQKQLWKTKIGKLYGFGRWGDGPRSNATVDGDLVFALGGGGDLICVDAKSGEKKWSTNLEADFGGEMMTEWRYSESPLVDGDRVVVTPGGPKGTLLALDRKTGKPLWQSGGLTHAAPYSSVMISNAGGVKHYVQTSYKIKEEEGFVSGFDPMTGAVLWSQRIFKKHSYAIAPAPIILDNLVYVTSGYGGGCHAFELSKSGKGLEAKELFSPKNQKTTKNTHGGVVLVDGHIYGHSEVLGWVCQDIRTGAILWNERDVIASPSGSICAADGRLYLLSERGEVGLIEVNPKEWTERGSFSLPEKSRIRETEPNFASAGVWANPVIANGRLYLRDQELIFCFDIKK